METEKQKFKEMTLGGKLEHIWEYYKLALLGITLGVALIVYIVVRIVMPDPESILNVTLVNAYPQAGMNGNVFERYLTEQGYNPKEETIAVNAGLYLGTEMANPTNATVFQALLAMTLVGEIDLLAGDAGIIDMIGSGNGFLEIDEVLPTELLEKYQDSLYTVTVPESGEEYVCAIRLPKGNPLEQDGYYEADVVAGIPYTAQHPEMAREMLLYLLGE